MFARIIHVFTEGLKSLLIPSVFTDTAPPFNSTTCGGYKYMSRGSSMRITSPHYPSNYSNSEICHWQFYCPSGGMELSFKSLEMEHSNGCTKDAVVVRNGTQYYTSLLARLCGSGGRSVYTSYGKYMWINFTSNANVTAKGFEVNVTCSSK